MIKSLVALFFQLSKVEVINTYFAKLQVSSADITRFKKWPRTTLRSGTSWNKRHVTYFKYVIGISWPNFKRYGEFFLPEFFSRFDA